MTRLTLGHSPDPDDAFMFYALTTGANGRFDTGGIVFEHVLEEIQLLNRRALDGELDVTAISFHAYPYVARHYLLLGTGASLGDGYGPVVVGRRRFTRDELRRAHLAVPGELTSAFLAIQLWLDTPAGELNYQVLPFDQIPDAVLAGRAEAGLLIHEAQLTYGTSGLVRCADLGEWWHSQFGLPLPLGGNVVHRRLAPELRRGVAALIKNSVRYALEHRAEALAHAARFARGNAPDLTDRFVGMYVNRWTLELGPDGKRAVEIFLRRAYEAGLIPALPPLEFVDP